MIHSALWRRIDKPGHDAARIQSTSKGRQLRGTAVFSHERGPACIDYRLELDEAWTTTSAEIHGFIGRVEVRHVISRREQGWLHNGARIPGLVHLTDLDLGFTPATNLQQLRRIDLEIGERADVPVAWFDLDSDRPSQLNQRYERRSTDTYRYEAPDVPYQATLTMADNGFVADYPGLWTLEHASG